MGENEHLSLKQLTLKTCFLIAITCPEWVDILASLKWSLAVVKPHKLVIHLDQPRKRRKPCQEQENSMNILFCSEDSNICPATTCLDYVNRTINFRKNQDNLFLSIKRPHKMITKSTIARWIKSILSLAGINTNMFTAHLTRAASSSTAKNAGVSLSDILEMGDWTNTATFAKFYYKPVKKLTFSKAVLQN